TTRLCSRCTWATSPIQERHYIPSTIDCHSEQQGEPPERQRRSHPGPITSEPKAHGEKISTRDYHDVQAEQFGNDAQDAVQDRQPIVRIQQTSSTGRGE